jgi:hypothetical protein
MGVFRVVFLCLCLGLGVLFAIGPSGVRAEAEDGDSFSFTGVVVAAPMANGDGVGLLVRRDGSAEGSRLAEWVGLRATTIVWHMDTTRQLPSWFLQPWTRVHVHGCNSSSVADLVIVLDLGRDYALKVAVEEWVCAKCGYDPTQVLTVGQCATIAALGSASWLVRDAVTEALRDRGVVEWRLLIWARHSPDPEIRARAELLLGRLGWTAD